MYCELSIDKSQPLGHGSYGAVYKAKCDQLPCAAKVLHPTILDPRDPGAGKIMEKFEQECALIGNIRHPHIVQYLGVSKDPESRLPVLLMELLDESLTNLLERSQQPLAFHVEVDICHDIALAVVYLHSNDIIHRDLSSNNVLIIAERRAKVTDFGMSKLANVAPSITPLTMCPGTVAYMPPEALREPPRYTKKLDCFSEGVLMIQVCTRLLPDPGPRTKLVQDFRSPTGSTEMPVLEPERRKSHIDLVKPTHMLLPIALDCLKYLESERPSSEKLSQRVACVKETMCYKESMECGNGVTRDENAEKMMQKIREMKKREEASIGKMQQQKSDIEKLRDKGNKLQLQASELEEKVASQERLIHLLNKQLEENERFVAEGERSNLHQTANRPFKNTPSQQIISKASNQQNKQPSQQKCSDDDETSQTPPPLPPRPTAAKKRQDGHSWKQSQPSLVADHRPHPLTMSPQHARALSQNYVYLNLQLQTRKKAKLTWRDGGRAPMAMVRGDTVTNGGEVYFANYGGELCSYNTATKRWKMQAKCQYLGSSLAVVNGLVTSIGGFEGGIIRSPKNNLLSLSTGIGNKRWVELLPPMPTNRCNTAAISTEKRLIVAGGESGTTYMQRLSTVEVLDIQTLVWSTVASLPHPYSSMSATVSGDDLYLAGGLDKDGETKSVLTCSLTELLSSTRGALSVWYRAADVENSYSTCVAFDRELLAVGGCDKEGRDTNTIHKYKQAANSWELIGHLTTARNQCLVAVLSSKEVMVVGGNKQSSPTDFIEIAEV